MNTTSGTTVKISKARLISALIILAIGIIGGSLAIWSGYIAPYLQSHALVQLQRRYRVMAHEAEVLAIPFSDKDLPLLSLVKKTSLTGGNTIFDAIEYEVVYFDTPTAVSSGELLAEKSKCDIKIEKKAVWCMASSSNPEVLRICNFKVIDCNESSTTAHILYDGLKELTIKRMTKTSFDALRNSIKDKHERLVAEAAKIERDRKEALEAAKIERKRIADERAKFIRDEEDREFVSQSRKNFPIGVTKRISLNYDKDIGSLPLSQRKDDKFFLTRLTEGSTISGASYKLQFGSGFITLVDSFDTKSSALSSLREYRLNGDGPSGRNEGWTNVDIRPASNEFSGDYSYSIDLIGVVYSYEKDAHFPIISELTFFSPASRAGVNKGDQVLQINGISTQDMSLDRVYELTNNSKPVVELVVYRFLLFGWGNAEKRTIKINRDPRWENQHVNSKFVEDTTTLRNAKSKPSFESVNPDNSKVTFKITIAAAEKLIRAYFNAGNSGSMASRADFLGNRVYFYTAWIDEPKEIIRRFTEQERIMKYRNFSVLSIRSTLSSNGGVNSHVSVQASLGLSMESAKPERTEYFIRVESTPFGQEITRLSDTEIPGWRLAKYRTRISKYDLRRSDGITLLSSLTPTESDYAREVILMNRFNYYVFRKNNRDEVDEPSPYFEGNDLSKTIKKRRDELEARNRHVLIRGDWHRVESGKEVVDIEILKDEGMIIEFVN